MLAALLAALFLHAAWAQERTGADSANRAAAAVYEDGKRLYDLGDFHAARGKFADAARLEPTNPRWHYNLGLAQRKLDNFQAARQAFLQARALDPDYKRAEIDDKLRDMGFDPAAGAEPPSSSAHSPAPRRDYKSQGLGFVGGTIAFAVLLAGIIMVVRRRAGKPEVAEASGSDDLLRPVSEKLIAVEHALRLREDPDVRSLLIHATELEQQARQRLASGSIDRDTLADVDRAAHAAEEASAAAAATFGSEAFTGRGEPIGCFFCACPLANRSYRRTVVLQDRGTRTPVPACPDCAGRAARAEAPAIVTGSDRRTHWSEIPDFDPYRERHGDPRTTTVALGEFSPRQALSTLAELVTRSNWTPTALGQAAMVDLPAARQTLQAHFASREIATQSGRSETARFSDHS